LLLVLIQNSAVGIVISVYENSQSIAKGFISRGTWNSLTTYEQNDVVLYDNDSYVAVQTNVDKQPDTNPTDWTLLAARGPTGAIGATGPTAPTGPTGPEGEQGLNGLNGANGDPGDPAPRAVTIEGPTASEKIPMFFTHVSFALTEIRSVVIASGGSQTVTFSIRYGSDLSAAGTEVVTGGITVTSTTTGLSTTSFNNGTIAANSFVWITTSAATNVAFLNVSLR
jgi:hypothetical protein